MLLNYLVLHFMLDVPSLPHRPSPGGSRSHLAGDVGSRGTRSHRPGRRPERLLSQCRVGSAERARQEEHRQVPVLRGTLLRHHVQPDAAKEDALLHHQPPHPLHLHQHSHHPWLLSTFRRRGKGAVAVVVEFPYLVVKWYSQLN